MSQENQVVRKSLTVRERSGRTLDQRLALRFPRLAATSRRLLARLPPTSRIRQAVVWRGVRLGVEAFNRRDFEAMFTTYHPEAEFRAPRELAEAGIVKASYRGLDGYTAFFGDWLSAWGDYRMRPKELIDLGDRFVFFDEIVGRGAGSGVPLAQEHAIVMVLENGRVIHSQEYLDPAEALDAAGLRE